LTIQQILLKYWGYSSFRPLQEEIIQSVLAGRDTLALLPTGGGKSVTFQVPALAKEGLCVVISPLIALMKDQVDRLRSIGIPAAALHSGMHPNEMDLVISNAKYGSTKLLYISPERLATQRMRDALGKMKVSLIAVDEAHCISQWGYDFRPPDLRIAEAREFMPGIPVLALTATATPRVMRDIREKLKFRDGQVFQQTFERKNLTYVVIRDEDKMSRLLKIIRKVKGSGVVYARNRKQTKEVAEVLKKNGVSADFYHAGLDPKTRSSRQQRWTEGKSAVMVSTNAFGMGIDKPDVRFVVHLDLPDCIEAYFQEAGRAGRDGKQAWAILLLEKADILDARHQLELEYPEVAVIRSVYQALGNHYQVPTGSGRDESFDFDLFRFASSNGFQPVIAYNSMKFLEKEGYILLSDAVKNPSKVFIKAGKEALYRFQVEHEDHDLLIKTLLRSYTGIMSDFTEISEQAIASKVDRTADKVAVALSYIAAQGLLDYIPQHDKPQVTFATERLDVKDIAISPANYRDRKKEAAERLEAMIRYAESTNKCRSQQLLSYFGECNAKRCGKCDVCLERNKIELNEAEFDQVTSVIKPLLRSKARTIEELAEAASPIPDDKVILTVRWLIDTGKVIMEKDGTCRWKS
jgi:ATP-dependent DNA helicase RecQ